MFILCRQIRPADLGIKKTLLNMDEISRIELSEDGRIQVRDKYRNWYSIAAENPEYMFNLLIHYACTFISPDEKD